MAEITIARQAVAESEPQKRIGGILLAGGGLLAILGILLLRAIGAEASANIWLKNVSPLIPLAGLILIGQGVVLRRLEGRRMIAWFLALPTVTFIITVVIFPTIYAVGLSLIQWDIQVPQQRFIFLQNYVTLLNTSRVWGALGNTAVIAVAAVFLEFLLGVGLAILLVDRFPGRELVITIVILPMMMAPIVVGQTWQMLWDTRFGAVNHMLSLITGQPVQLLWLGRVELAIPAIIITDVWQHTPFVFLVTLAGFLAVNTELYEAAAIDGANPWQMFWRITLPIVRPVLLVALMFRFLDVLRIFDIIFILTNGGPGYGTENLPFYLYQQGFAFGRFGYTAAGSIFFLIITVIISSILVRRIGEM